MILNPFRLFGRYEKLKAEALDEAHHLRRRHGRDAVAAALEKLQRRDLTKWGRQVTRRAIRLLQTKV